MKRYRDLLQRAETDKAPAFKKGNCKIEEKEGDLVQLIKNGEAKNALHMVAADVPQVGASAGIAAEIFQSFPVPEVPHGFKKRPGAVLTQPLEGTDTTIHHVMYKQRSVDKCRWAPEAYLENMDRGFDGIVELIKANKLSEVWMPRVLCGCDHMQWPVISRWLLDKLADSSHPVTIHVINPPRRTPRTDQGHATAQTHNYQTEPQPSTSYGPPSNPPQKFRPFPIGRPETRSQTRDGASQMNNAGDTQPF
jgi:hypothetical protein